MKRLIAILFLSSCVNPIEEEQINFDRVDTILIKSRKHIDTVVKFLPKIDKHIEKTEKEVLRTVESIKTQNAKLKEDAKIVKTITIRDTIIIKEKTNFWGRKKTSTDSITTIDSTENEKNN
jgi:hypothetical protein